MCRRQSKSNRSASDDVMRPIVISMALRRTPARATSAQQRVDISDDIVDISDDDITRELQARFGQTNSSAPQQDTTVAHEATPLSVCRKKQLIWHKTNCTHCLTPAWRDSDQTVGNFRCKECVKKPERVQTCGICLERCVVGDEWLRKSGNHSRGCDGHFCQACLLEHCNRTLDSGALACECPSCRAELRSDELQKISPDLDRRQYFLQTQARKARVTSQTASLLDSAPELLQWAEAGHAQICPHCATLVERSDGCRHMTCQCRGQFCFICGGEWPCGKADACEELASLGASPRLAVDVSLLRERRRQRLHAFVMGSECGPESCMSLLREPDLLRRIAEQAAVQVMDGRSVEDRLALLKGPVDQGLDEDLR